MKTWKLALPAGILMTGFLLCTSASYGTQAYAKKEGKQCTYCHGKVESKENMPKNLNATGKCYKENEHSLAKCPAPEKK
ncbi:MAG: hypothetical protein LAQ30_05960 [Acidobacteriia bacterium]|nr:hypothetical protein [Terriglobia bacterium]